MVSCSIACKALVLFGFGTARLGFANQAPGSQVVLGELPDNLSSQFSLNELVSFLDKYDDPIDAFRALRPLISEETGQPRMLHVFGEDQPHLMTEGNKIGLHRDGKKFIDITDYQDLYTTHAQTSTAGKAHLPNFTHSRLIEPLLGNVSTERMRLVLKHLTSYYNRYYGDRWGAESAQWLHDHIAEIIVDSPFNTHISLEYFTHPFPQPSIIARFEPRVRNFSQPLTIIGAHQDSANYLFPLLPAPGADDDGSGTVSTLEAFRILAERGYTPLNGPVEFHFYAAEEGGLLGSQAIAAYKKAAGVRIGAMIEFDMTAFVERNATETIALIKTQADEDLTEWVLHLAQRYISTPVGIYEHGPNAGFDYMSYTKLGFPAAFATEANDTMDIDDHFGVFSLEAGVNSSVNRDRSADAPQHMARFSELAISFAIEQAGWDNAW